MKKLFSSLIMLVLFQSGLVMANPLQGAKVQVEVIIFQSLALRGWTEEYWPDFDGITSIADTIRLGEPNNYAQLIEPSKYSLVEEVSKMTTDRGYDVLAHFAWQQPLQSNQLAIPVLIEPTIQSRRAETSPLLGKIRLFQERFIHAEVYLELDRQIPVRIRERFAEHQQIPADWLPDSWRFKIDESRRMRYGQLHYLDHPIFGVLIKVDRVTQ
ncbi:CsiV family protein [Thiomicrospira sp. R3]|uniref:CsiV family protein n=1 Tax=Thiomicrospira sp. R3 TaxID=3035472 RepID=UPI00259B676E|nr:CsiV family protein [Thiomicrospira sp. R3]WFE68292.1 CsiV family protein [Thiomicrospira sp. R3]